MVCISLSKINIYQRYHSHQYSDSCDQHMHWTTKMLTITVTGQHPGITPMKFLKITELIVEGDIFALIILISPVSHIESMSTLPQHNAIQQSGLENM